MKFYMHQRIFGENLIKIGLILSAQWRFSEERYQACPVTLTPNINTRREGGGGCLPYKATARKTEYCIVYATSMTDLHEGHAQYVLNTS